MILNIIGIALGIIAIGLVFHFRKDQQLNHKSTKICMAKTDKSLIALQEEFTNYQVSTGRKIAELENKLDIQTKKTNRQLVKLQKELPVMIRKVVGHIEFARPLDKK